MFYWVNAGRYITFGRSLAQLYLQICMVMLAHISVLLAWGKAFWSVLNGNSFSFWKFSTSNLPSLGFDRSFVLISKRDVIRHHYTLIFDILVKFFLSADNRISSFSLYRRWRILPSKHRVIFWDLLKDLVAIILEVFSFFSLRDPY